MICILFITIPFAIEYEVLSLEVMLVIFIALFSSIIMYMLMAEEEISRFTRYKGALPIRRRDIVNQKYILNLGIQILFTITGWIVMGIDIFIMMNNPNYRIDEIAWLIIIAGPIGLFLSAFLIFGTYAFGREKAAIICLVLFIFILVGGFCIWGLIDSNYTIKLSRTQVYSIFNLVGALTYIISYFGSQAVYKRKEIK